MPPEPAQEALPSDHLDMLRGLAALSVFVWHLRNLFFVDYAQVSEPTAATAAFYFLTGFGHEAVMVFFVLSGYFIARSLRGAVKAGRWHWRGYALSRFTRLQVVLLPALALGALWDYAGIWRFGADSIYSGDTAVWGRVIISFPVADRLGLETWLGNALFLQEIAVAPFGSNGPLWSLSYEGWYYVLFPLAFFALAPGLGWRRRVLAGAAAIAVLAWVGPVITQYFAIWLLGALVAWLPPWRALGRAAAVRAIAVGGSGLVAFAAASVSRTRLIGSGYGPDLLLAAAFALFLYVLVSALAPSANRRYVQVAGGLAGCSYTLYLVHTPVLVFGHAALTGGARWQPDAAHLLAASAVFLGVFAYAYGISRLTEARTEAVRGWLAARLGGAWVTRRVPAPTPVEEAALPLDRR